MTVPEKDLREIVRRIIEAADPDKIILFGSAARGDMGPHSDVDLLVVKAGDYHHLDVARAIYRALPDINLAIDAVVVKPEEIERYKDSYCMVFYPALREGKVLYERSAISLR